MTTASIMLAVVASGAKMETYLISHDVLGFRCEAYMGKQCVARTAWYATKQEAKTALKSLIQKFSIRS